MTQTEDVTRAVFALLVAQTAHDLSVWGQWQADLGAECAPASNELFPLQPATENTSPRVDAASSQPPQTTKPEPFLTHPAPAAPPSQPPHAGTTPSFLASFSALHVASNNATQQDPLVAKKQLDERIRNCRQCSLGNHRAGVLCGYGPLNAQLLIVCAGGNPYEFEANRVMAGKADNSEVTTLFDNIIKAMTAVNPAVSADTIYFTNVIKCCAIPARQNLKQVASLCSRHLRDEVRCVNPKVILIFGQTAYDAMFADGRTIIQARGQKKYFEQIPAVATHHPMECLKNRELKKRVWDDVRLALHVLKDNC